MAVIQVLLTDTFDGWRTKTNSLATQVGDVTLLSGYSVPSVDNIVEAINDLDGRTTVATKAISDTDADTKIHTEKTTDEDKLRFDVASTEKMFIDATGVTAHNGTSAGGTANALAQFHIDSSTNSGIQLNSGTTNTGNILFGDSGDNDIGKISYNHNDNSMTLTTNANSAANSFKVDSSGNVSSRNIGDTSTLTSTTGTMVGAINENAANVIAYAIALG
tara:strand:+ start:13228 stop:13884 length:657 start_codon:yes stop_codon:yes gene_type:complete